MWNLFDVKKNGGEGVVWKQPKSRECMCDEPHREPVWELEGLDLWCWESGTACVPLKISAPFHTRGTKQVMEYSKGTLSLHCICLQKKCGVLTWYRKRVREMLLLGIGMLRPEPPPVRSGCGTRKCACPRSCVLSLLLQRQPWLALPWTPPSCSS